MAKPKRETGSSGVGAGLSGASVRAKRKKKDKDDKKKDKDKDKDKEKEDEKKEEQREKNENKTIQKTEQTNKEKGGESFSTEAKEAMRKFTFVIAQAGVHSLRLQYNELRSFIPADPSKTSFEANPTKCRYKDVPCWEKTRVVLKWPSGVPGDFIHANWVTHPLLEYQFICCQGPLEATVSDFWRCVWQEKVKQIIMLCRCQEMGKDKCAQYWPANPGDSMSHHGLAVKCEKVDNSDRSFIHSRLQLTYKDETRHVDHRQWTSWPDKSVPKTPMAPFRLLQYTRKSPKNPTVIHCSAGVGRTGTLVCIELIYKALLHSKVPDVPQLVKDIRSMRSTAVQTEDQYVYCHYAILQLLHIKGIVPSHFIRHFVREYETYLRLLNENGGKNLPLQATSMPNPCAQCTKIAAHMNDANVSKDANSPPSDEGKNESRRDNKKSKQQTSRQQDDDEQGSKREKKESGSKREKKGEGSKRERKGDDNNTERKATILKRLKSKKGKGNEDDKDKDKKEEKDDTAKKKKATTRKREENRDKEIPKEEEKKETKKEEHPPPTAPVPTAPTEPAPAAAAPIPAAVNAAATTSVTPDCSKDLPLLSMMSGLAPAPTGNENQANVPAPPPPMHFDANVFETPIEDAKAPEENMQTGMPQQVQTPPTAPTPAASPPPQASSPAPSPAAAAAAARPQSPSQTPAQTPPAATPPSPVVHQNFQYKPAHTYTVQQAGGKKAIVYHRPANQPFIKALAAPAGQPQAHILVNMAGAAGAAGATPPAAPGTPNNMAPK
uniref:Protein-tyrosine-phosphatase n=1 Tax=Panagrellus redivivus TaxID=6233 RepID=A0A7E4UYX5_PANRE